MVMDTKMVKIEKTKEFTLWSQANPQGQGHQ